MENLVILTVQSTHFHLVDYGTGKLLVDAGWPEHLPRFLAQLKQAGIALPEIRYVMMTHHHPDHAGLVQTVKRLSGARLLIHQNQLAFLNQLANYYQGSSNFEPIQVTPQDLVSPTREDLRRIGVRGEIVTTPGHSHDSVSLVLDSGMAFIGDLHLPDMVDPSDAKNSQLTRQSWKTLADRNVKMIYPAHGSPFSFQSVVGRMDL